MIDIVTATEIDTWAKSNPRRAQEILPELIANLILATSKKIVDFNFPIEKGIQYSGYDGVLQSDEQTNFFPLGKSVWEFGTDADAINKFKSDIEKRSKNSLGVNITDSTFIFATLKIWNHRKSIEEIINESKEKYKWKEIRIIDASKIALWLKQCPAVMIWMSQIIGKYIPGILSIDQYWNEWCSSTTPNLTTTFFLSGRNQEVKSLSDYLNSGRDYKILVSESCLESTLFIIATIYSLNEKERNIIKNRVLIVKSEEAWDELTIHINSEIILIPIFNFSEDINCPNDIAIILPVSKYAFISTIKDNRKIELPQYTKLSYQEALRSLHYYDESVFSEIERNTKRSFLPFYRLITNIPSRKQPGWLKNPEIKELIPMLFVGGWNDRYEGDKEIIEKISGVTYSQYLEKVDKWLKMEDAPIFKVINNFQATSIQDMWTFLFLYLTDQDFDKLKESIIKIFGEIGDDSNKEKTYIEQIFNGKRKYSQHLLHGILISLIMINNETSKSQDFINSFVYTIVQQLLKPIYTYQQWNNIAPYLPLLVEASPEAVLEKLDKEINEDKSGLWELFYNINTDFMSENRYTHILWTLEKLVWYENYMIKSILILAKICEKHFDYKLSNSPANSLCSIFCLWNPKGYLNAKDRCMLLENICDLYPITGWNLIDNLLPSGNQIDAGISKPHWSILSDNVPSKVTMKEYYDSINMLIDISIKKASNDSTHWNIIIKHISWYKNKWNLLKEHCIGCCKEMDDDSILSICESLRQKINSFRKYKDADWNVPEEYVVQIESLLLKILPNNINQYRYLFKWNPNILNPIPYERDSYSIYERQNKAIYKQRLETVELIIDEYGTEELIKFCANIEDVGDVSMIISEKIFNNSYDFDILKKIKQTNYALYVAISNRLFSINGIDILIEQLERNKDLSIEEKGDILCHTDMRLEIWKKINAFDEEIINYYWKHITVKRYIEDDKNSLDYLVVQLLKYNRPFSAFYVLSFSEYDNTTLIIEVLEKCIEQYKLTEENGLSMNIIRQYDVLSLFEKLYKNQNVDIKRVACLEIAFLEYFEYDGNPKCLIKYLWNHPEEYVNMISIAFRNDADEEKEFDEEKRMQARKAYSILHLFRHIPGCNDEIIDENTFNEWIDTTSALAEEHGYSKAFEICIGKLLSYAPKGQDNIFPHEFVRKFLEERANSTIINEFIIEILNQRGVYTCTGGIEEKKIADKYYDDAKKIRIQYPNTASILDKLGDSYRKQSIYDQEEELVDFRD